MSAPIHQSYTPYILQPSFKIINIQTSYKTPTSYSRSSTYKCIDRPSVFATFLVPSQAKKKKKTMPTTGPSTGLTIRLLSLFFFFLIPPPAGRRQSQEGGGKPI